MHPISGGCEGEWTDDATSGHRRGTDPDPFAGDGAEVAPASAPDESVRPEPRPAGGPQRRPPELSWPPFRSDRSRVPKSMTRADGCRRDEHVGRPQVARPEIRPAAFQEQLTMVSAGVRTQPAPEGIIGRRGACAACGTCRACVLLPSRAACRLRSRRAGAGHKLLMVCRSVNRPRSTARLRWRSAPGQGRAAAYGRTKGRRRRADRGGGKLRLPPAQQPARGADFRTWARTGHRYRGDHAAERIDDHRSCRLRDEAQGPILQKLHRAACGPFGTVLGPNSDRFHQNHPPLRHGPLPQRSVLPLAITIRGAGQEVTVRRTQCRPRRSAARPACRADLRALPGSRTPVRPSA